MISNVRPRQPETTATAALRFFVGLFGPPLVWLATLQLIYGIAPFACEVGISRLPIRATEAATLAVIAATVLIAWRGLGANESAATAGTNGHLASFLAAGGLVLVAQVLLVIVAQELAVVFFEPCK